jgi:hypothetical protein
MSITIRIKSGEDKPFAIEIERFPTEVVLDKAAVDFSGAIIAVIVLVFLFVALNGIFQAAVWPLALALGVLIASFLFVMIGRRGRQDIMRFEKDRVVVTEAGLLYDTIWEEAYSAFKGVSLRKRRTKSGSSRFTYQIIELKHPDPQKTLPLFVDLTGKTPTRRWLSYVDIFDLPPIKGEL